MANINSPPTAPTGSCFSSSLTNSAPSYAAVGGSTLQFSWNDIGGGSDDKDYNDAVYAMTCPSSSSAIQSNVMLVN